MSLFDTFPYRRLVVIGTTGMGKSTLAERLSRRLGLDFIELDALHWEAGWRAAEEGVFRRRVETATHSPAWAVAGNYSRARPLRGEAALESSLTPSPSRSIPLRVLPKGEGQYTAM